MSNYLNISLQQRIDSAAIDTADMQLTVQNNYAPELESVMQLDTADMDAATLEAFRTVTDYLTYAFEAGCPIIIIDFEADGNVFDFENSYMRDQQSSIGDMGIPNGQLLGVRFEFPGFTINPYVNAVYEWGKGFTPADTTALLEMGVDITEMMEGDGFSLETTREVRITFYKPDTVPGNYVIQYPAQGIIIQPS